MHVRCRPLREDSIQKCKRPAVVNTLLAIAGGDSRIEISTFTDDQNALNPEKGNELLNMEKLCVVEVFDRSQSQQVLSTRLVSKQRLDGSYKVRLVARTDFYAGTPKLTSLRALLTIAAIHRNPSASGDCHSAFHQSTMPSESEPVYVEPALEAQLDSSRYGFARKLFKDSRFLSMPGVFTAQRKSTTWATTC